MSERSADTPGRQADNGDRRSSSSDDSQREGLTPDWWWDFSAESLTERVPTPERDQFPGSVEWHSENAFAMDRLLASLFVIVFMAGVLAALDYLVYLPFRPHLLTFIYWGLWIFTGIYAVATAAWAYEAYLGWRYTPPPHEYGPAEVQVRVLTIAAEEVVQETIETLPDELMDRHVITEEAIEVDGAAVHVVPDGFECAASDKGRALEWARRELACDKEFVLFLDEDTLVTEFDGLPDADIVQFREWPMFTESYLTYWSEVLRMGFQTEQIGFAKLGIPLYAWGGGIAVRTETEESTTWNFDTLIEDTVFAWRAVQAGAEFEVVDTKFRNQAPPSVRAMFEQRRRWLTGTLRDEGYLPFWFRGLMTLRNVSWVFSPFTTLLVLFSGMIPMTIPGREVFRMFAWALFIFSLIWVWRGWRYYEGPSLRTLPVFIIYPFVVAIHSAGAAWGFISPPESFETTEKSNEGNDGSNP